MEYQDSVPKLAWRLLGLSVALMFLIIVIVIGLISAGTFDPKPVGEESSTHTLETISVDNESLSLIWLKKPVPNGNFSLKLTASRMDGESDIIYGLAIGADASYFVVAVSPLGYLTFWEGQTSDDQSSVVKAIIPFQTWPHVRMSEESNEIWLDVISNKITAVRINRELLWQGSLELSDTEVGLWAQSYGQPGTIDFENLELFGN